MCKGKIIDHGRKEKPPDTKGAFDQRMTLAPRLSSLMHLLNRRAHASQPLHHTGHNRVARSTSLGDLNASC
jgi:hypothetical protein